MRVRAERVFLIAIFWQLQRSLGSMAVRAAVAAMAASADEGARSNEGRTENRSNGTRERLDRNSSGKKKPNARAKSSREELCVLDPMPGTREGDSRD
jgi:hypothetical protein